MVRRVLDVGQCGPDHGAICRMLERAFEVDVVSADGLEDTLARLRAEKFDLVMINRKLDIDYSDGLEIVSRLKADPELASLPVMLVSNYAEYQDAAVAAGAVHGFGKARLSDPATVERLRPWLS